MLLAGAVGVAGLGPVLWITAGPAWAFTAPVKIAERAGSDDTFEFAPNVITIDVDDKILWTNKSTRRHTVTSDAGSTKFDSGQIPAGGQWERRFTAPGTYTYHCEVHPDMVGRIEVGSVTTTTTAPPPTTAPPTTAPPTTAPPTTTTTAPAPTTSTMAPTTTTAPRPASGAPPPAPSSATAAQPASSTSTSVPSTTTTTTAPATTATSAPPAVSGDLEAAPPAPSPETTATTAEQGDDMPSAAGPSARGGDDLDAGVVGMVAALVAVGLFAAWTLIRVRPGRV